MSLRRLLILAFAVSTTAAGCNRHGDRPATYAVSGTVNYQNAPVADAEVSYQPVAAGGRAARGQTDASGQFHLRTYFSPSDDAAGAVAGDYVVTITKFEKPTEPVTTENVRPLKSLVPPKYGNARTSPLKSTVAAGSNAAANFALTDE